MPRRPTPKMPADDPSGRYHKGLHKRKQGEWQQRSAVHWLIYRPLGQRSVRLEAEQGDGSVADVTAMGRGQAEHAVSGNDA